MALGPNSSQIVVVGGLAAPRLGLQASVAHEGTSDIDVLVEVAMDYDLDDADYAWLQEALLSIGARPTVDGGSWRWLVDGVCIDLLCDRYPNEFHGEIGLPGAPMATVMQLPGPAAARADARIEPVEPGRPGSPDVRVAGLGGYLLAKAGAASVRRQARDYYDFWWVTLQTDGGPAAAARAVNAPELEIHRKRQYQAVMTLAADGLAEGDSADAYARTMLRLGSQESYPVLVQDVVAAAGIIAAGLREPDVGSAESP